MLKFKPAINLLLSVLIVGSVGLIYWNQNLKSKPQSILDEYLAETPPPQPDDVFVGEEILPPFPFPQFKLINYSGETVTNQDLLGKTYLLTFAYTSCPDTCPIIFGKFLQIQNEFESHIGEDFELVFITIDPEVDTPERLAAHVSAMGGKWLYLTEELSVMEETWQALKVFVEKEGNIVNHTNLMYLVDDKGLVRVQYIGLPPESAFISDIYKVMSE